MTLETLLWKISEMAIQQKIINSSQAGTDIYTLNTSTIKDYPVLFTSPTGSQTAKDSSTVYTLTLYYFERLLQDSANDINIISVGIEQLKNVVRGIDMIPGVISVGTEYDIVPFVETEAFSDRIAGCYATIKVEAINETTCFVE